MAGSHAEVVKLFSDLNSTRWLLSIKRFISRLAIVHVLVLDASRLHLDALQSPELSTLFRFSSYLSWATMPSGCQVGRGTMIDFRVAGVSLTLTCTALMVL